MAPGPWAIHKHTYLSFLAIDIKNNYLKFKIFQISFCQSSTESGYKNSRFYFHLYSFASRCASVKPQNEPCLQFTPKTCNSSFSAPPNIGQPASAQSAARCSHCVTPMIAAKSHRQRVNKPDPLAAFAKQKQSETNQRSALINSNLLILDVVL